MIFRRKGGEGLVLWGGGGWGGEGDADTSTNANFRDGNLKKLDEAFSQHEHFFVDCGIFLMLEKLKIITFRNLFKKV